MGEEELAILGQDVVLREKDELKDLLDLLPHKAQLGFSGLKQKWTNRSDKSLMRIISAAKTNESLKVEYTCIDVNSESIVIGCNLGIVFMYNRKWKSLSKFTCENKQVPIVSIKLLKRFNFIASGQFSGAITIFQYDEDKCGQMKVPLKCTVQSHHQAPITSMQWTPDGTKLFTADSGGHVAITVINMDEGKTHTVFICKEDTPVTQICFSHTALLISTLQRTLIWPFNTKKVVQVGKQSRKVFGNFGACFFPDAGPQPTEEIVDVYAARPGLRLWKATIDGKVLTTMIFKDSVMKGEPIIDTHDLPPHTQLPNQSEQKQFGSVIAFDNRFLVSWQGSCLWVMDPDTGYVIGCHSNLGCVVDVSVCDNALFVLSKGDQHCIRKIEFELRLPCILVEELDLNEQIEMEDEERSSVFQFEDDQDKLDKLIDGVGSKMIGAIYDVKSKVMPFLSGEGTSEERSDDNLKADGATSDENIGDYTNRPFESSNELAKSFEKGPDADMALPLDKILQEKKFDHLSLEAFPKDIVFEGTSIGKSPKRKQKNKALKSSKKTGEKVRGELNFTLNGGEEIVKAAALMNSNKGSESDENEAFNSKQTHIKEDVSNETLSNLSHQDMSETSCEIQMDLVNNIVEMDHHNGNLFHADESKVDLLKTNENIDLSFDEKLNCQTKDGSISNSICTSDSEETSTLKSFSMDNLPDSNAIHCEFREADANTNSLCKVTIEESLPNLTDTMPEQGATYNSFLVDSHSSYRENSCNSIDEFLYNGEIDINKESVENILNRTNNQEKCLNDDKFSKLGNGRLVSEGNLHVTSDSEGERCLNSAETQYIDAPHSYSGSSIASSGSAPFNTNQEDEVKEADSVEVPPTLAVSHPIQCIKDKYSNHLNERTNINEECNEECFEECNEKCNEVLPVCSSVYFTTTNDSDLLIDNIKEDFDSDNIEDIVSNDITCEPKFFFNLDKNPMAIPSFESKHRDLLETKLEEDIVSSPLIHNSIHIDSHTEDTAKDANQMCSAINSVHDSKRFNTSLETNSHLTHSGSQNISDDNISKEPKSSPPWNSGDHKDIHNQKTVGINYNEKKDFDDHILKTSDLPAISSPVVHVKISHQRQGSNASVQSLSERCKEIRGEAIESSSVINRGGQLLGEDDTLEANIHRMDEDHLSIASHFEESVGDGKLYPHSPFPAPQIQSIYSQQSVNLSEFSMSHFLDTDTEANNDMLGLTVDYDRIDVQNDLIESLDSITDVEDNLYHSPPEDISGNELNPSATGPVKIKKRRSKNSSYRNSPCSSDMEGRPLLSPNTTAIMLQERLRYLADSWAGVETPSCGQIQFIACSESLLWLIDNHDHIFYSSSSNQNYTSKKLDGKANMIASNQQGTVVWCVDRQKISYYRIGIKENNLQGGGWEPFEKHIHYIAVDNDCVWAIKTNGDVFVRTGVSLQKPSGVGWITVKVASDLVQLTCLNGLVWAIDIYNHVQIFQGDLDCMNSSAEQLDDWCELPGITASHVTLGSKSVCWIIDSEYGVWFNQDIAKDDPLGGTWYQLSLGEGHSRDSPWFSSILNYFTEGNEPKLIVANESSGVLILGKQGSVNVAHGHLLGTRWETKVPFQLKDSSWWSCVSAAGTDMNRGYTWALQPSGELFCFKPGSHGFNVRPPNKVVLKYCSAGPRSLWVLTAGLDVYIRLGISDTCPQGLKWFKVDMQTQEHKRLMSISCGNHVVWAVDYYGSAWFQMGREEGVPGFAPAWISVEGCPLDGSKFTKIAVGPDDRIVWACDDKNNVYARKNVTDNFWVGTSWEVVSGTSGKDVTISLNHVWALCPNGDVMCRFGVSNNNVLGDYWKKVPGSFEQISVSPNDELWGIDRQGHLYQRQTLLFYGSTLSSKAPSYNDLFSDHNDWEFI